MPSIAIIGAQWGDEGKGKITDFLSANAEYVVRYQGGDNAGHTIHSKGVKYSLHLLPSGALRETTINILGNGMVINPVAFLEELKILNELGKFPQIFISNRAHVILPYHQERDKIAEKTQNIGTTLKGIGPAYQDKAARIGLRMGTFSDKQLFKKYLTESFDLVKGPYTKSAEALFKEYAPISDALKPMVSDTSVILSEAFIKDKRVVFEGAQGTMLDIEQGTYPYVTSSSPSAAGIPLGAGVAPKHIQKVLGIVKAYNSRVGAGPFVSEMAEKNAHIIREIAQEYGTTTGRPRRIGHLDLVALKHAHRINHFDALAVTLFDVLGALDELKLVTGYRLNGQVIDYVPAEVETLSQCEPVFETMPGFKSDVSTLKDWNDLPEIAKNYLKKIETVTGVPVAMISVGPDRRQTIMMTKIF